MQLSKLVSTSAPNVLQTLDAKRIEMKHAGREVINLSAGTPDLPPPEHVLRAVSEAALNPGNYAYTLLDFPELQDAVMSWYDRRYGVEIGRDELLSVNGSQEGFTHIFHVLCDPGDVVIIPDPGYSIFSFGPRLAGAAVFKVPLKPENNFLIDFDDIPAEVARKARVIIASYPANPVGAVATEAFYEQLIAFAKKNDIVVIHDNAYSEFVHEGPLGGSFLAMPGAKDVGIEFNSLSKSYNLSGLRVSFVLGNREIIGAFTKLRTQIDYGLSTLDQIAAITALNGPQDAVARNRAAYRERRNMFCTALREVGWDVPMTPATMFTWFPIPDGYTSESFCMTLLEKTGVVSVPGSAYGANGGGWVRFALVRPPEDLKRAAELIGVSGMFVK
ncbi:MAG: aminotransferase class I/II-fold pyridoxal phosphate-dependent enzyme [Clostridiales Family XIII bacterium]|jgi:LL-diaminopimelate aminotransferase|nr:aminotransferase class I/II-fold pyridoxal phosphate-dependent enzyme [Clostridiales Family XIII bacterium]